MTIWKHTSRLLWNVVAVSAMAVMVGGVVAVGTYQSVRLAADFIRWGLA